MLLLLISFIAGILTVLAPCVLPLLPMMVAGSVTEKKTGARPYVIAISLATSIIIFTLILKVSTALINLSPNVLTGVSGGILIALGIVSVWPEAWEWLIIKLNLQAASQRLLSKGSHNRGKYVGPILIGAALGPIFSSCSPTYAFILASVLPRSFGAGLIYLIIYSIGLVLALLLVALVGRKLVGRLSWAVDTHSLFRRIIGGLFIVIGLVVITGKEVSVETWVANHLPFDETRIERVLLAKQHTGTKAINANNDSVLNVNPTPAPELAGLTNWINSPPLTIAGLRGHVVLVDFWTYSCINCIRSLPYVEKWYSAYQKDGLVVIGVSTPEFAFEHNPNNVAAAVKKDLITYPVALDNDYDTWNAFDNDSWPADYLIDKTGDVRYVSLGEGDYDQTERAIQALLGLNQPLVTPASSVPVGQNQTPETYFGTNRAQGYVGKTSLTDGAQNFNAASSLSTGQWTLGGGWEIDPESITSESNNSTLTFKVSAKDVYVVAGSNSAIPVAIDLPGAQAGQYGSDVTNGSVVINGSRLYHIVSLRADSTTTVTLKVPQGVSLYTFTFGS